MSKIMKWCIGLALAGGLAAGGQSAEAVQPPSSWGRAVEVPGLGALNKDGHAEVFQVSCASAGSCAAGGFYRDRHGHGQGFVVSKRNGRWGLAVEVPGLGALRKGSQAWVLSVSCGSAGNCAAGGFYADSSDHRQGFVVNERNGHWGRAIEVPGLAALNKLHAEVVSVSCTVRRNCAAGGVYGDGDGHQRGFVVSEKNGRWDQAIQEPGPGTLNQQAAGVVSVSCASPGNCAAGGQDGDEQGFVVSEQRGVWGQAIEVPGLAALDQGRSAEVVSVSCASAGSCAAGGFYSEHYSQGFVVSEQHGVWGKAIEVPGLAALNKGGYAQVNSVSCASAGNCAAGGSYTVNADNVRQGFVVSEQHGVWGHASMVPGLATLNKGGDAEVVSVSCASAGNCAAGGDYADQHRHPQGFVVSGKNGVWRRAIEVPGLGTLNKVGDASVFSVSCAAPGRCAATGHYVGRSRHQQGFVTQ
jgi:hypothetical protein